jgi:hypothetical protein
MMDLLDTYIHLLLTVYSWTIAMNYLEVPCGTSLGDHQV